MLFKERFRGTSALRKEALYFEKHKRYTQAPKNTLAYKEYWEEQRHYCLHGYTANGTTITGRHYFYLNFCPILGVPKGATRKEEILPFFYDYDKYYFDKIDEAIKLKKGIVLNKGRRKGFSFKGASLLTYEYTFIKKSISFVGAYYETYSQNTFSYAVNMLDSLLKHTAFGKRKIINKEDHKKAGYKLKNGTIGGTGSEIKCITFGGNVSNALGNSANLFIFEEVGKWNKLLETFLLTEPLLKEGNDYIGLPILQGTSGDLSESVSEVSELFFNPEKYNFLAVENVWDKEENGKKIGLFFPACYGHNGTYGNEYNTVREWYGKPMIDENGNSEVDIATQDILDKRELLGTTGNIKAKYLYTTENPLKPSEAFMIGGLGLFNTERINAQLHKVKTYKQYEPQRGRLEWELKNGSINYDRVVWVPDKNGKILVWEHPEHISPQQRSPYISGIDPVDISLTQKKAYHSDGAMLVMKTIHKPIDTDNDISQYHKVDNMKLWNAIVCEYVDRPNDVDVFYENTLKINTYYQCHNRQCMVENNKKNIIDFYNRHRKTLVYLYGSPEILEAKIEYKPSVKIGTTMTAEAKEVILQYLTQYLEKYTEHIFSQSILEELLIYNNIGNFDRTSALFMLILLFEEKSFIEKIRTVKKEFINLPMYIMQNGKLISI